MRKKIAVYTFSTPGYGGSFQYGASILSALSKLDSEKYECLFWCSDESWIPVAKKFGIEVRDFTAKWWLRKLIQIKIKILKILTGRYDRFDFNYHQIQCWNPDICISLEQLYTPLRYCKIIGPIHDLMHRYEARFPEVGDPEIYYSRDIMFSAHCASASAILVDSQVGKQHVCEIYHPDPNKIFVLPFIPSPLADEATKPKSFPLDDQRKFIFYPAQLWLHKNHANLLKAVKLLSAELDIQCVFTGTTDKNGAALYKQLINDLELHDRVHHLGYVSDSEVRWLYEHARCMIMPSFFGPTNIPPLEAMLAGCPVAVADVYAMRERYGEAALYFNPANVNDIVNVIKKLWTDDNLCCKMAKRGFQQISLWTQNDFEQRFLDILHQVECN